MANGNPVSATGNRLLDLIFATLILAILLHIFIGPAAAQTVIDAVIDAISWLVEAILRGIEGLAS